MTEDNLERQSQLKAMGVPAILVELACREHSHDAYFFRCSAPEASSVGSNWSFPEGVPGVILWQCQDWAIMVRQADNKLEYLAFDLTNPELYQVIAYSEQGVLANLFSDLIEDEDWDENPQESQTLVEKLANECGFSHLPELMEFMDSQAESEEYAEVLAEWTKTL